MDMKYIRFVQVKFASYNLIIGMYHQVHHWIFVVRMQAVSIRMYRGYFVLSMQGIDIANRVFYFLDPFGFSNASSSALNHFR